MIKTEIKNGKQIWKILIDTEEIFKRVSLDSNYREHALIEPRGSKYVLLDDDVSLFNTFVRNAMSELWLKIARMSKQVSSGIRYTEDFIELNLEASDNHDPNLLFTLGCQIDQFIDARVLCQWFELNRISDHAGLCERDAARTLANLLTTVHFRKKAVKRPIDPIF